MTNVPPITFTSTGPVAPTEAAIFAGRMADYQEAFGGSLNESLATAQGQLVTSDTAVIGATNDQFLNIVNQIDPANADGTMQDALGRIYDLTRIAATSTLVTATCTGASGTVIPLGALARATDGTIYQSTGSVTISSTGTAQLEFQAVTTGPIACPAGALNTIYRVIPGWDSITNASDGVAGRNVETRAEFETRRQATIAANSNGMLQSVRGKVLNATGVVDCYAYENDTASPVTYRGVSVAAKSIYICAYGGTDADVAQAIYSKKMPGCGYTGSTTVAVEDRSEGYTAPYPTYNVSFQRPTSTPLYFAVSIANNGIVPADAALQIQNAIIGAFIPKIASSVYALSFAAVIGALGSWAQLVSITVGTSASPTTPDVLLNMDQIGAVAASRIAVTLV